MLDACCFFDHQRYRLFVVMVMPDHVHLLMQPLPKNETEYWSLASIMHSIKSYSAKQIAKVMTHMGTVWQPERCDRIIRDVRELNATWEYICHNPVKAGLSELPDTYPCLGQNGYALPISGNA